MPYDFLLCGGLNMNTIIGRVFGSGFALRLAEATAFYLALLALICIGTFYVCLETAWSQSTYYCGEPDYCPGCTNLDAGGCCNLEVGDNMECIQPGVVTCSNSSYVPICRGNQFDGTCNNGNCTGMNQMNPCTYSTNTMSRCNE